MIRVIVPFAFVACVLTLVLALCFLLGVFAGAAADARLLASASPWLLLVYPAYWIAAWTLGRWVD